MPKKMNRHRFADYQGRRAERYGKVGRKFEEDFSGILTKMQNEGLISSFEHHRPHSAEDESGADFVVVKSVAGKEISKSFGITISHQSLKSARLKHPEIPQF